MPSASLFGEYYVNVTDMDSSTYGMNSTSIVRDDTNTNKLTSNFNFDFIREVESRTKNVETKTISDVEIKCNNSAIYIGNNNSELFLVEHSVMRWLGDNLKLIIKNAHLYHTLTHTAHTGVVCNILVIIGRQIESLIYQEKEINEDHNYTDTGGVKSATLSLPGYSNILQLSLNKNNHNAVTKVSDNKVSNENDKKSSSKVRWTEMGKGTGIWTQTGTVRSQERTFSLKENMFHLRCTASELLSTYRGASLFLLTSDVVKETSKFRYYSFILPQLLSFFIPFVFHCNLAFFTFSSLFLISSLSFISYFYSYSNSFFLSFHLSLSLFC